MPKQTIVAYDYVNDATDLSLRINRILTQLEWLQTTIEADPQDPLSLQAHRRLLEASNDLWYVRSSLFGDATDADGNRVAGDLLTPDEVEQVKELIDT